MASQLFEEYDPYGDVRRRARLTGDRRPTISDLLPEEEKAGMLRTLAHTGMSGVSALGWLLDTPGAVIRGTLEGGPLKGLSALLPGAERVSGRDLLRSYGLAGDEDTWGNFGSGLATEIFSDPLTYLTLGANQVLGRGVLTPAAKLAQRRGLWRHLDAAAAQASDRAVEAGGKAFGPREFARKSTLNDLFDALPQSARDSGGLALGLLDEANEIAANHGMTGADLLTKMPLTRSHGWSIPLVDNGAFDLFGEAAGDWLARAGDQLGAGAAALPGAARLATMFDASVLGHLNPDNFKDARQLSADRTLGVPAMMRPTIDKYYDANEFLRGGIKTKGGKVITTESPVYKRALRNALTDTLQYTQWQDADELEAVMQLLSPAADNPVRGFVDFMREQLKGLPARRRELGLPAAEWEARSGIGIYSPAYRTEMARPMDPQWQDGARVNKKRLDAMRLRGQQVAPLSDSATIARAAYLDLPAREELLAAMSLDADLAQRLRDAPNSAVPEILNQWAWDRYPKLMEDYTSKQLKEAGQAAAVQTTFDLDDSRRLGLFAWLHNPKGRGAKAARSLPDTHPLRAKLRQEEEQIFALSQQRKAAPQNSKARQQLAGAQRALFKIREQTLEEIKEKALPAFEEELYSRLADTLRYADPQHAATGVPLFGGDPVNDLLRYFNNSAETQINAQFMAGLLGRNAEMTPAAAVQGGANYSLPEAMKKLGLDIKTATDPVGRQISAAMAKRGTLTGAITPQSMAADFSINKALVDEWASRIAPGQAPAVVHPLIKKFDDYTQAFKTAALLYPSRYSRDLYSGGFASATKGLFSPESRRIGSDIRSGDYKSLKAALKKWKLPWLKGLNEDEQVKRFLVDMGVYGLATGSERDVLRSGAKLAAMKAPYPGATPVKASSDSAYGKLFGTVDWLPGGGEGNLFSRIKRSILPPAIAGEGRLDRLARGALWDRNPLAEYGEQWSNYTDAANRYGAYIEAIKQGNSPAEAKRLADLTQVNYSPEAFTPFERTYMRRLMPFYSYTRGILPLVADNLLASPEASRLRSGLDALNPLRYGINPQSAAIRVLSRASEPQEGRFTPESLRQRASIPVPQGLPLIGLPVGSDLQRYLANIDLYFQSPLEMFSIGVGNTPWNKLTDTITSTGMNILGQTHPLPKTLLEALTDRQFFSGNNLSDLYSTLEQFGGAPGRSAEQIIAGTVPFGSRAMGLLSQAMDDRLTAPEKIGKFLFNTATGLRFKDVKEDQAQMMAARDTLNKLLSSSTAVRTYENLSVRDEDLAKMSPKEKDLYLLYKVLQSDAAKRARERKKQQAQALLFV